MPVYVDTATNRFRRMKMSHMIADTPEELASMARRLGLRLSHFQRSASAPHFDICQSKKKEARALGAIELKRDAFVGKLQQIKKTWPRADDGAWRLEYARA